MEKDLEKLGEENTYRFTYNNAEKYRIGKRQIMMTYMDSGSKHSPPSRID